MFNRNDYAIQWNREHPDEHRKHCRDWARRHPVENRKRSSEWQKGNPDKARCRLQAWRDANRDKKREQDRRRLTKKRGANGSHTLDDFKVLCQLFRGRCVKCLKVKPLTRDHIVPISKGGTDNIDNIQPMCQSCNSSKSDNTADYRLIAQRLRIR